MIGPNGVISTIAGIAGIGTSPPCCSSITLPPPIANGTPARSVSIDQLNSAAIALSEQGVLYISTGMQLLRLNAGTLDVIATRAIAPLTTANRCPIWDRSQSMRRATSTSRAAMAGPSGRWHRTESRLRSPHRIPRRSGGDTSVLERAPDGVVYGESGPTLLKLQGGRATPGTPSPRARARASGSPTSPSGPTALRTPTRSPASELGSRISSYASFATTDRLCSGNRPRRLRLRLRPESGTSFAVSVSPGTGR